MKKIIFLFSLLATILTANAQSSAFCEGAIAFPNSNSCFNNQIQLDIIQWYSFVAGETAENIELKNLNASVAHIHSMEFYTGTCAGNNLILSDSIKVTPSNDTVLVLNEAGLTIGNTYYIKLLRGEDGCVKCNNIGANYDLCLVALLPNPAIGMSTIGGAGYSNLCFPSNCHLITICANTTINITAFVGSSIVPFQIKWNIAPGATDANTSAPFQGDTTTNTVPTPIFYTTPGIYPVQCFILSSTYYSAIDTIEVIPEWTASFTSDPNPGCNGFPVTLTDTTGPPPIIYGIPSTTWTIAPGFSCGPGVDTQCVYYNSPGTYNPSMHITNGFCEATVSQPIVITNTVPIFSYTIVCVGNPTIFTDSSTCEANPSTYFWNFGDGTTSTLQNPSHTYPLAGTYTVSFTVDDPLNGPVTITSSIIVKPLPPAPIITGDFSACSFGTIETYSITNFNSGSTYTINLFPLPSVGTYTPVDTFGNFTVNWNSSNGGTISLTVNDTTTGCSNGVDFAVGACCYYGTNTFINGQSSSDINAAFGSYIISDKVFSINGVFTVDVDMTWRGCDVKLGPNAIINILPGVTLYLTKSTNSSTHLWACSQMWDKIQIQPTAILKADFNTLIEDAKTAIYSVAGGIYQLNGIRLNRNYKHMELTPYAGTHAGTIINTKLICQAISGSLATLNPPYLGYRTQIGIDINGVQSVQIGLAGATLTNNFNNMNLGIQANRSSVQVYNNNFKSMDLAIFPNTGIAAIKATGYPLFPYFARTLTVGDGTAANSNTFQNCFNGIVTDRNMNSSIQLNDFKQINNTGISITKNSHTNSVLIQDNDFATTAVGIGCLNNSLCHTSIRLNRMSNMKNFSTGIWIQEISSSSIGAVYSVFNNTIKTVEYGIRAENLSGATIDNNTIETEPYVPAFLRSIGIKVSGSYGTRITSNDVRIVPTTYATKNGGIEASLSPASYMFCNTVKNMGFGIKCAGTMPSDIFNNSINNDFYGLWLDNGGFIGNQDNPSISGNPSYNKWSSIPATGFKTYTSGGTDGSVDTIFYKVGAIPLALNALYNPSPSTAAPGSLPFKLIFKSSGANAIGCPLVLPTKLLKRAEDIALENISFPGNDANSKWLSKHCLLVNIKNDAIDVSGDAILQAFVNQSATENLGTLIDLNSTITDPTKYNISDMTSAQALSNSISPNNDIETNMKMVNDIVINNYLANITFTPSQISDLRLLANKCPFTDGVGVYQARVLLAEVDSLGTIYSNPCETGEEGRSMMFTNDNIVQDENTSLFVFPNPATNQLTINYKVEATDEAVFEIYNLMGEKVLNEPLNANKNEQTIAVSILNSGIYFYKCSINGRNAKTSKLVIIK